MLRNPGLAAAAALLLLVSALPGRAAADAPTPEQQLLTGLSEIRQGNSDAALQTLQDLLRRQPNFRVAQLIHDRLVAAMDGVKSDTQTAADKDPAVQALTEEAQLRMDAEQHLPPPGSVPSDILQLSPEHPYVVVVDLPRARLYLLKNGGDGHYTLTLQNYAAMGRNGYGKQTSGDLRTPVGVYHVTGWIPGSRLPAMYGAGAFPLSYPNPWDLFNKRSGAGIWLHGVPADTYARAPRSSEGCVTMANDDLLALRPYLSAGETPVILSDDLDWVPESNQRAERDDFLARIEDWRSKWAAIDTDGYLAYYDRGFTTEGMDYVAFAAHKKRVNARKKFIGVRLDDINLFRYPGSDGSLVLAEFTLVYRSNDYDSTVQKQQFWKRGSDGAWRIFREENR